MGCSDRSRFLNRNKVLIISTESRYITILTEVYEDKCRILCDGTSCFFLDHLYEHLHRFDTSEWLCYFPYIVSLDESKFLCLHKDWSKPSCWTYISKSRECIESLIWDIFSILRKVSVEFYVFIK